MKLSNSLLLLPSVLFATQHAPLVVATSEPTSAPTEGKDICNDDRVDCQNGYFALRDPDNDCKFFDCPVQSDGATSCTECTDEPTPNMISRDKTCETATDAVATRCFEDETWVTWKTCQRTCFFAGRGYDGDNCCEEGGVATSPPTSEPVADPTDAPVAGPTDAPAADPTDAPVADPTDAPVAGSTDAPVADPTDAPVADPTDSPVAVPTDAPVPSATDAPAADPTDAPIADPTDAPVADPTDAPVADPTDAPVADPTDAPVADPTDAPVADPTDAPVADPTDAPAADPTDAPAADPTDAPAADPTDVPVADPTDAPVSSPTADDFTCPPGVVGNVPVDDCRAFAYCENGVNRGINACPAGLLFNVDSDVCDWAYNVTCGARRSLRGSK